MTSKAPILWHSADTRSFRVLWMLEEIGAAFELRKLPFPPRVMQPAYLAENPLGTIPLYVDGDVRMTESVAILQFLAAKHGQLSVAADKAEFADYLEGLHYGEATLTWPLVLVLRYSLLEPKDRRQPQVVTDYTRWFSGRLERVDTALADGRPYFVGGHFTAADISVGYALLLAEKIGLAGEFSEITLEYWQRLKAREGFIRAKAAQKQVEKEA